MLVEMVISGPRLMSRDSRTPALHCMYLLKAGPDGSFDPVVAQNSEVLGSSPGRFRCLSSGLCICSDPNCSKAGVDLSVGPLAREIIGGPVSLTYDWPVWPANILILDLRQNVPLQPMTSCGL